MKSKYFVLILAAGLTVGCKKTIDLYPVSNLNTGTYYSNLEELQSGLAGAYRGLQAPMLDEWALTELRTDNSKQGQTGSSSVPNQTLNQLDMFSTTAAENRIYSYYRNTYLNIRNANIVLQKLGVTYNHGAGTHTFNTIEATVTEADRKQMAGEALIIRAHHYFNLIRLFGDENKSNGGVFLIHTPISPSEAFALDRSSVQDIYKFIEADLKTAAANMNTKTFSQVLPQDRGRVTGWTAKALLGKVYLTQGKKTEALAVLNDVRLNSGHALETSAGSPNNAFSNVFATDNEVNEEILFTVRYKAGGFNLGAPFMNQFAPLNSGAAVVPGNGQGLNFPTADLDSTMAPNDRRRAITLTTYTVGTNVVKYNRKFIPNSGTLLSGDSESDWPILRFSDVLLMIAEAEGQTGSNSLNMINLVRTRAGLQPVTAAQVSSVQAFEDTLAKERRMEFAFENHRWFDLLRYNTTMQTITIEEVLKEHFAFEHPLHYANYPVPVPTLESLQARVDQKWFRLPIPNRELEVNPRLKGQQNEGY